jgi:hypothetical protein
MKTRQRIALQCVLETPCKIENGNIQLVHPIEILYQEQIKTSINLLNQN